MNTDFKLELQKEDDRVGDTFYRYRYETCKIWFSQNQSTGNIYRVNIIDEEYPGVEYYSHDTEDRFYPTNISFIILFNLIFHVFLTKVCSDYQKVESFQQLIFLNNNAALSYLMQYNHCHF